MSSPIAARPRLARVLDTQVAAILAYYVLLFAGAELLVRFVPGADAFFNAALQPASDAFPFDPAAPAAAPAAGALPVGATSLLEGPAGVALTALLVMGCACLLMLPVAWVYTQTRQRKGFRQSVVQTLIILPLVVAGVAILVKNSVALAFSLGGIVGAVSFRNTLRDTKDAIYIFLSIGVGLAAGIQAMGVAAALSFGFNVVALLLWYTDFGRSPAGLRGHPARLRLQRALEQPARTQTFVAEIDREILRSLGPEQLDALAERARRRRRKAGAEAADQSSGDTGHVSDPGAAAVSGEVVNSGARNGRLGANGKPGGKGDAKDEPKATPLRLRLAVAGPLEPARHAVEAALERLAKRWEPVGTLPGPAGGYRLEYRVRARKRMPAAELARVLREEVEPFVTDLDLDRG